MPLLSLLSDLAGALRYWLQIKATRAKWELQRDIAQRQDDIEDAIFAARSRGDHNLAELLRSRFAREQGFAERLPDAPKGTNVPG